MSEPLKNWKAGAYAALAEYYKVEAERASFEERLEQAKVACIRSGVSFRYGHPEVPHDDAYACNCGAVVTYDWTVKTKPETHVCAACREKTEAAVRADQAEEARRAKTENSGDVHPPGPVLPAPPKPPVDDIPF